MSRRRRGDPIAVTSLSAERMCYVHEYYLLLLTTVQDDDMVDRFPCYRLIQDSVVGFMRDNFLLYEGVEEASTTVTTLFAKMKTHMEGSPAAYQFVQPERFLRGHEALGLTLLEHVNRGHIYGGQAHLRRSSFRPTSTIGQLFSDKTKYAVPAHSFGFYDGHFVLNCSEIIVLSAWEY